MTLTLRIENFDTLDNGGPIKLRLDGKGAQIGRSSSMDWTLPDPARHISSHHFDIVFENGAYFLQDVSTNGTFLQGQKHRLEGKYRIRNKDKFTVGHYIIVAELGGVSAPTPPLTTGGTGLQTPPTWQGGGQPAPATEGDDPWDFGAADPVAPLPAPKRSAHAFDDVAGDFVATPTPAPTPPPAAAPPQPAPPPQGYPAPQGGGFGGGPPPSIAPSDGGPPPSIAPSDGGPPPSIPPSDGGPPPSSLPGVPMPSSTSIPPASPPRSMESGFTGFGGALPGAQPAPPPSAPMTPPPAAAPGGDAIVAAFAQGAGLPPGEMAGVDPAKLAFELGRAVRIATEEIMRMLQDRAAVKQFTRGGERTMRSATGNNPMKFLTDVEQALTAMFVAPRQGFLTGPEGFENALSDIRRHQKAVFAALQPALAQTLTGLAPDQIESEAGGGVFGGSSKSKAWDTFVERWDKKAETGENGMLDAFLEAFAKAYAEASLKG